MSNSLRVLSEERWDRDQVCALLGWSMQTFYRACRRGLEHLHTGPRSGGKIITSRQEVERYLATINGIDLDDDASAAVSNPGSAPTSPPSRRRQRELARVDADLAADGF
jgi:hypothetical protein